jgi:hypothetical protein
LTAYQKKKYDLRFKIQNAYIHLIYFHFLSQTQQYPTLLLLVTHIATKLFSISHIATKCFG